MQHPALCQHHGTLAQVPALLPQLPPQFVIAAAIADRQVRDATAQFRQLSEMAAEGTAAVKHQYRMVKCRGANHRLQPWRSLSS